MKLKILGFIILSLVVFVPVAVSPFALVEVNAAETSGLVPCDGSKGNPCDFCAGVKMANIILDFLIQVLTIVAVIAIMVTGFKMMAARGSASMAQAKSTFQNIIIGFILVLAAWLIVDTILQGLIGEGLLQLTSFSC